MSPPRDPILPAFERGTEIAAEGLALLEDLVQLADDVRSLREILHDSMRRMAEFGGWDIAHASMLPPLGRGVPDSATGWYLADPRFDHVRTALAPDLPGRPDTLPQRTVSAGEPIWIPSLADDPDFAGTPYVAAGLASAVCVPLLVADRSVAVLEFFAVEMRPPDPGVVTLFGYAGSILGRAAERQLAVQAISDQESRLRQVIDGALDAFVIMDRDGRITEWNREAENLFGWTREEALGRTVAETLVPSELRQAHEDGLRRYLETGEGEAIRTRIEFPALDKGGGHIPVELTIWPLEVGKDVVFSAFVRDVTERRRLRLLEAEQVARQHAQALEREVMRGETRYRMLAESIPQHVWTADAEGEIRFMNSVGTDYFGVDVEALRTSRGDRVHEEDRPAVERAWATAVTRGRPYEVRARLLRGDGEPRWFLTRALPRFDEEGGLTEWYGTNTDVHDHVEAEHGITRALAELSEVLEQRMRERSELERKSRELEQTAMALERANRDLDQFAHVAGHDLRAPLRGIASLADFLRQDLGESLSPQATELLDLLTERVRRMRQMVDGLLAYARVGHFDVEPERVDVEEMVGELSTILTSGGGPEVHLQPGLPVIETLRLPLEHVFQNLLSNAVRFAGAEGGRIDVGGARQPDGQWEFWVADNGPGIAEQLQDKIWGMFQTLTASEGTGIGLAVVKRHVESCGGSIRVESAPGRGARFRFTWPSFPRDEERE